MPAESAPAARSRPRRFWPRFTLRVVLVLMTLLCVGLAYWTQRARQQKRLADQVRLSGGQAFYDFEADNLSAQLTFAFSYDQYFEILLGGKQSVEKGSDVPRWLLDPLGQDYFHTIVRANVCDCDELQEIEAFPRLQELVIGRGATDDDIEHVARLRHLKQLCVGADSKLTDRSLKALATMPALEIVFLDGTFSAKGLADLAQSASLRQIRATGCDDSVDLQVVELIRRAGRVKSLYLHADPPPPLVSLGKSAAALEHRGPRVLGYDE
jgi:hypothetical protein